MTVPLEIAFHGVDASDAVEQRVESEVEKLERHFDRITSCRVVIEAPHRRHSKGNLFDVKIHMTLPDHGDIVVNHNHGDKHQHEDPYVAIRDAFAAARRQLQDYVRIHQGKVKHHDDGADAV